MSSRAHSGTSLQATGSEEVAPPMADGFKDMGRAGGDLGADQTIASSPSTGVGNSFSMDRASFTTAREGRHSHKPRASSALFMETVGDQESDTEDSVHSGQPAEPLAVPPRKKAERIYFLDWLRILAIYIVVFYHCIQCQDWIELWKGVERQHIITFKCSALQVGMPIFFHISGRAQAVTRGDPTVRRTVIARFQRLIIPFIVGYLLLVPFWQYVWLREEKGCKAIDGLPAAAQLNRPSTERHYDCPQWFIPWLIWFFQAGHYEFSVGWLWFLPTLFFICTFGSPLFLFAEQPQDRRKYGCIAMVSMIFAFVPLCLVGCPVMMCVMCGLGPVCLAATVMVVPFPPRNEVSWCEWRWLAVQGTTLMQILCQVGLVCSFSYDDLGEALKMIPAVMLFYGYYTHGYFVQRWAVGRAEPKSEDLPRTISDSSRFEVFMTKLKLWTGLWQVVSVGMMLLSILFGSAGGEWERELFPIYSGGYKGEPFFAAAHICGAWALVGLVVAWFQAYANKLLNATVYKRANESCTVVYIFHFVFVAPFVFWVLRDGGLTYGPWKLINPLLTLGVGVGGPYCIYMLLLRNPTAGALFGLKA